MRGRARGAKCSHSFPRGGGGRLGWGQTTPRSIVSHRIHIHPPLPYPQRRFERFHDPRAFRIARAEPILDDLHRILRPRMNPRIPLRFQQLQHLLFLEVLRHRHREGHDQPRIAGRPGPFREIVEDGLRRVAVHRATAMAAMQVRRPREEQLEVVVELGHRADRGARRAHRVGLVDGDGRRNALDPIHQWLVHAVQELARIGRERLHVASLAFGVERVEHQRRLAGAGDACHHHQLARGDRQGQVLEVVLAGAVDDDRVTDAVGERGVGGLHDESGTGRKRWPGSDRL